MKEKMKSNEIFCQILSGNGLNFAHNNLNRNFFIFSSLNWKRLEKNFHFLEIIMVNGHFAIILSRIELSDTFSSVRHCSVILHIFSACNAIKPVCHRAHWAKLCYCEGNLEVSGWMVLFRPEWSVVCTAAIRQKQGMMGCALNAE